MDRLVFVHILEHDELGICVDVHTEVLAYAANGRVDFLVRLVACNCEVIDDMSRYSRVSVPSRRLSTQIVLETIAAIEEFADVPADVVVKHESSTWMLKSELFHI